MQRASLQDFTWESTLAKICRVVDLEPTAREFKALQRVRKIRSAAALLRLALMYGPGGASLRGAAALAGDAGIAELSDKGVEGRLRKMGDWLEHILVCLLRHKAGAAAGLAAGGLNLSLVDGSVVCSPGRQADDWRLHASFDPGRGRFSDLVLTNSKIAERVDRTRLCSGQVVVQDRGYARVRDFQAVLAARADFITRIGWRSVRLLDRGGQVLDLLAHLPKGRKPCERTVWIGGLDRPVRLIVQRLPPDQAARQQRKRARKSSSAGHQIDPRTTKAAGYLMLLTSLPAASQPVAQVLRQYRQRWQIELGFKRMKTLGNLDELPASHPDTARTWLLAHLIAAVLTDDLAHEIVGFSPSAACNSATDQPVAGMESGARHHSARHSANPPA